MKSARFLETSKRSPTTHYNDFFNDVKQLKATKDNLEKVESFFNSFRERIRSAETLGLLVLTDKGKEFPVFDYKFYEPEGASWIL